MAKIKAVVYFWPNALKGLGHIAIHVHEPKKYGTYLSSEVKADNAQIELQQSYIKDKDVEVTFVQRDCRPNLYGKPYIKIELPEIEVDEKHAYIAFCKKLNSTSVSYNFLTNNCAHVVARALTDIGYLTKFVATKVALMPKTVAEQAIAAGFAVVNAQETAILKKDIDIKKDAKEIIKSNGINKIRQFIDIRIQKLKLLCAQQQQSSRENLEIRVLDDLLQIKDDGEFIRQVRQCACHNKKISAHTADDLHAYLTLAPAELLVVTPAKASLGFFVPTVQKYEQKEIEDEKLTKRINNLFDITFTNRIYEIYNSDKTTTLKICFALETDRNKMKNAIDGMGIPYNSKLNAFKEIETHWGHFFYPYPYVLAIPKKFTEDQISTKCYLNIILNIIEFYNKLPQATDAEFEKKMYIAAVLRALIEPKQEYSIQAILDEAAEKYSEFKQFFTVLAQMLPQTAGPARVLK
jgi:hypothetical protein